jgi:uncharacterized NAD(P)/FAD-binding protein YdhS
MGVFDVVVVGGGFSGTMLAVNLLRRSPGLSVAVIDKGAVPGRGLAYSTRYDCHLLNVPAGNMSAFPEEPDHFFHWARANFDPLVQVTSFLPRRTYGRYVGCLLEDAVGHGVGDNFRWIHGEVSSFAPGQNRTNVRLKDGTTLVAQFLVLAPGNFLPATLKIPGLSESSKRYVSSAWAANALHGIPKNGSVLLIGSGLTSVDVAVALKSEGFAGHIHILSRHGLLPQSHRQTGDWPQYWNDESPRKTRELLRLVREQIRAASAAECDWRPVIDSLRPVTHRIWHSLPLKERKRFLRHVRAYWEVHRHRVAPDIGDTISRLQSEGQATLHAGRLTNYREFDDHVKISLRDRKTGAQHQLHVDRVINCTGPQTDCRHMGDPLVTSILAQGMARPDPLFLGFDVDSKGALIDSHGTASSALYAIGPLRKGFLWETVAVPEIREQASQLAGHLASLLATQVEDSGCERLSLPLETPLPTPNPAKT